MLVGPDVQGRTGTFVLGWRYGSKRARRAWPGLKWVQSLRKTFQFIMGPGWQSPLSHPGQTAPADVPSVVVSWWYHGGIDKARDTPRLRYCASLSPFPVLRTYVRKF